MLHKKNGIKKITGIANEIARENVGLFDVRWFRKGVMQHARFSPPMPGKANVTTRTALYTHTQHVLNAESRACGYNEVN